MSMASILLRSLQFGSSLALALLAQAQSPFAFRMAFTHPATDYCPTAKLLSHRIIEGQEAQQ